MPVLRYFAFVGAALLALLFVVGWELPPAPAVQAASASTDLSTIRIQSDRKWPERVVFDTSAITPAPTRTASAVPAAIAPRQVADASGKVAARDAFAQLTPADMKKPDVKPAQKRKVAKRHVNPPTMNSPTMLIAQRPQPFGLFGLN